MQASLILKNEMDSRILDMISTELRCVGKSHQRSELITCKYPVDSNFCKLLNKGQGSDPDCDDDVSSDCKAIANHTVIEKGMSVLVSFA